MEARPQHPVGRFDPNTRGLLAAAQTEAERRGGRYLVSGLIMLEAPKGDAFSSRLLSAMNTDLLTLTAAIDSELSERSFYLQDQPATLVNEAIESIVRSQPSKAPGIEALLAAMLRFEDSMACRVARRLRVEPADLMKDLG